MEVIPFLTMKEIVQLDSASCMLLLRSEFEHFLEKIAYGSSFDWRSRRRTAPELSGSALNWFNSRQCTIEKMHVASSITDQMLADCRGVFARTKFCSFSSCSLSHQGFVRFANSAPMLADLGLNSCRTFHSALAALRCCVHLQKLNMNNCDMEDGNVELVSNNCPNLKILLLFRNKRLTDPPTVLRCKF